MYARSLMVLGIDIGGTKLAMAAVDDSGRVLARAKAPIRKEGLAGSVGQVSTMAGDLLAQAGLDWSAIQGAGACIPGIYYAATGNAWTPNLWGWDPVPLRAELASRLPVPVSIDSDRAACVLGEQWLGAARGLSEVVFLAIGTGIGAGILSGGRLIRGANDIAGAAGWFALSPERKESYTRSGCFESEAAGPAVARRMAARLAAGEHSLAAELAGGCSDSITAETVAAAARRGDAAARSVLAETAGWIAMGAANLISALNPQMVVLGGGLMQAGDLMIDAIRRAVLDWAQPVAARDTRIELSRLGEDAGLTGAARLALGGF